MAAELKWNIGSEGKRLEGPPFRAYFYWLRDGEIERAADFSKPELIREIASRRHDDEEIPDLRAALARL